MLEGLARLHAGMQHRKKFTRLKERFKMLEDGIGAIDFYDAAARSLESRRSIPAAIPAYLKAQAREKIQHLNDVLAAEGWSGEAGERSGKIRRKLEEVRWMNEVDETLAIEQVYRDTVSSLEAFVHENGFHFDNMEKDVHELRRKLRWLSIYPAALRGTVQLGARRKPSALLRSYQTPAILQSPYNQMPDPGPYRCFLLLDRNYFYALSWIIDKLGQLKDEGLLIVAVTEACQQLEGLNETDALHKACRLLGKKTGTLSELLKEAGAVSSKFFSEQLLAPLVIGTVQPITAEA